MLAIRGSLYASHRCQVMVENLKKRSNRISVLRPGLIEVNEQRYEVVIKNISFGGVYLISDLRPETGDEVILVDGKIGTLDGKVIRQTDDGFAVYLGQNNKAASYALRNVSAEMLDVI